MSSPGIANVGTRAIQLGERPDETAHFIAELRDHMSAGKYLQWRGTVTPSVATESLWHLPPPASTAPDGAERIKAWQTRFRPGLCYFRRGPGFVQIRDIRFPAAASYTIDDEALLRIFTDCLEPRMLAELTQREREGVELLLSENLALRVGDHVVTIPYRMRRWPVPASEV